MGLAIKLNPYFIVSKKGAGPLGLGAGVNRLGYILTKLNSKL
jgi:hypothetical protein